ncbi:hypothetical protein [Cyclobacterium jeungdonense]|uniref:Uncharacterized protein n=1 Tax=Cyclobacterium jeungdonense TaxID=708087 RepID=A0ABT8CCY5_9BACT|nr:hypothetical protein [Cyclobacterium jeungdonense]MDN3690371.1 hypothetical protein [Cyclobacterium jeungdonense]
MQEKWVFDWKEQDKKDNLKESFDSLFSQKAKELGIFLSYYTRSEGAVAENVHLLEMEELLSPQEGLLWLGFQKVFYNACLNIDETDPDKMQVRYLINPSKGKLVLTGPDVPEREPDEL